MGHSRRLLTLPPLLDRSNKTGAPLLQPIETRLVMLQTGMRAPMGLKVRAPTLETLETATLALEEQLKEGGIAGLSVATINADRIIGKPPIQGSFPPDASGMTINDRRALQQGLTAAGFDTGGTDGVIGSKTTAAINAYQSANGLAVTGEPSLDLLARLQ